MSSFLRLLPILAFGFFLSGCISTDVYRSDRSHRAHARTAHHAKRVTVCHKGRRTIRVDRRAARRHFRHGDWRGTCRQDRRVRRHDRRGNRRDDRRRNGRRR